MTLPVDRRTALLAERGGEPFFRDVTVGGVHLRLLAEPFGRNRAEQLALPLAETDSLLSRLRLILFLVVVGGIALAALLGLLVAGTAVLPLKRLTQTTEHVTRTQDLSERIAPTGEDEIGRLASSFNAMLDALERSMTALDASVGSQRQLVADASHELRTPVTSVRTNIELLQRLGPEMDAAEHGRLLDDVVEQLEELTRAHQRPDRPLARGGALGRGRGRAPGSARGGGRAEDGRAGERHAAHEARALDHRRRACAARARRRQPARQRRQVQPRRSADRRPAARQGADRARPRPRHLRGGPARTSSTASTAAPMRGGVPARGSAWRSCARSPSRWAARSPPSPPPAAAR